MAEVELSIRSLSSKYQFTRENPSSMIDNAEGDYDVNLENKNQI